MAWSHHESRGVYRHEKTTQCRSYRRTRRVSLYIRGQAKLRLPALASDDRLFGYYEAKDDKSHFQVDRLKALSEIEMEVLAWEVLVSGPSAERRAPCLFHRYLTIVTNIGCHRERPQWPPRVTKPPAGGDRAKTWSYKSFGTFGARFAAVRDACRVSLDGSERSIHSIQC